MYAWLNYFQNFMVFSELQIDFICNSNCRFSEILITLVSGRTGEWFLDLLKEGS